MAMCGTPPYGLIIAHFGWKVNGIAPEKFLFQNKFTFRPDFLKKTLEVTPYL